MSPTQRSKKYLESLGFTVEIVERWNPWARVRHDLYGVADLLALGPGLTLAVQTTTYPHMKERQVKIRDSKHLGCIAGAGWSVVVHGWKAPTKKVRVWTLRQLDIVTRGCILPLEDEP